MNYIGLIVACFLLGMSSPVADRPISAPTGGVAPADVPGRADSEGPWTVVVFGVKGEQPGGYEQPADPGADRDLISQMIVTADWQAGSVRLASVPTDLTVADESFETGYGPLGEIYRDSGPEGCMEVLGRNLNVAVEDYVVVPWKAAADAVNILGGIDIEVTDEEAGELNARITEAVQATGIGTFIPKNVGLLHMDGVQAVAYMNLTSVNMTAECTPEEKAERRHRVSEQILKQAASAGLTSLKSLLEVVEPQIDTSLTTQDLLTVMSGCRLVTSVEAICVPQDVLEGSAVYLNGFLYGDDQ